MPTESTPVVKPKISPLDKWMDRAALLVVLIFLVSGILTLPRYGLTWDEGLGNVFFGERYYFYLTTFQEKYLDVRTNLAATRDLPLDLFLSPYREHPYVYPPLADTISAASMHLLSYNLKWMDPVDAFHLPKVLLSTLFLWVLYRFFARRAGRPAALLGLLFLSLSPRFWGEMHFNPKDIPETVFFGLTVMAYAVWYEKPGWSKALWVGLAFAAALAVKMNAVFIPFVLLLGLWRWDLRPRTWLNHLLHLKQYWLHYALMAASTVLVYYLTWPYIYKEPLQALSYFRLMASQEGRVGLAAWNWQPLMQVFTTQPEMLLLALLIGLGAAFVWVWKRDSALWRLTLVWALLPVVRISLPGMVNFDGIRHFLEFLPAAAMLAGLGAVTLAAWLGRTSQSRRLAWGALLALLLAANTADALLRFYPYEYIYYNRVSGGLSGARALFGADEATDYWASSYREGLQWINRNAGPDAHLSVPLAGYLPAITRRVWLRPDIELLPEQPTPEELSQGETYVMFILRPGFYRPLSTRLVQTATPVHEVRVDGLPVMVIYRYQQ